MAHTFLSALCAAALAAALAAAPGPGDGEFVVAPPYAPDPALSDQGNPRGATFLVVLQTSASSIFNGSDPTFAGTACDGPTPAECCHKAAPVNNRCAVNAQRSVSVYVPPHYSDGDAAPVLVMQDGPSYFSQVSFALDNLGGAAPPGRSLPAFVAVSVQNGGCDAIGSERGLEYDTMSDRYARFISEEVLPAVAADPALRAAFPRFAFSADPDRRAAFGCSSGGAAALTMAYQRPDLFRRVAAYSATLVDQQNHADETGAFAKFPLGAWSYHSGPQLLASSPPAAPLRIFHNANELDLGYNLSSAAINDKGFPGGTNNTAGDPGDWADEHHNWLVAGNRTAAALRSAGYRYRHVYALGAHHCDAAALLHTLGDTLVWLWGE